MTKSGRNDPCPCGSGRKYKKCCIEKHPRDQYVYIGHKEPLQGLSFNNGQILVHPISGGIEKADAVFSQTQYTTKNGKDKVLSCIPNIATINIPAYLVSEFDVIYSIDTNTKQISNDMVSVSCIKKWYVKKTQATQIEISQEERGGIFFKNCPDSESERFAWYKLITMFFTSPTYSDKLRVAVLTDHDLSNHPKYNNREIPIFKNFYLPCNFALIYASGDKKENILNMLIMECDKDARNILELLEKKGAVAIGNSIITINAIPNVT